MDQTCKECNKRFTLERTLRRHMINAHNITLKPLSFDENVTIYKCLECNSSFKIIQDLINHLESFHNTLIEQEELTFKNENDFIKWKRQIEQSECCKYALCGKKSRNDDSSTYVCNKKGPKKFNKDSLACISNIKTMVDPTGNLYVARVKTHYGHDVKVEAEKKIHSPSSKERRLKSETNILSNESKSLEDDVKRHTIKDMQQNLKNDIKTKLDIILTNLDSLNNHELDKLSFYLDSVCVDLGFTDKRDKSDIFGQIIISSNSNFDHNYL